jgi:hypothetical protein
MAVNIAMAGISIIFGTILRFYLVSLNKRLERGEIIEGVNSTENSRDEEGATVPDSTFRFLV